MRAAIAFMSKQLSKNFQPLLEVSKAGLLHSKKIKDLEFANQSQHFNNNTKFYL